MITTNQHLLHRLCIFHGSRVLLQRHGITCCVDQKPSLASSDSHPQWLSCSVAEEAAADAKKRAGEARKWIDNWKSKH